MKLDALTTALRGRVRGARCYKLNRVLRSRRLLSAIQRLLDDAPNGRMRIGDARLHGESALAMHDGHWEDDYREATGYDFIASTCSVLALPKWADGQVEAARELAVGAIRRAESLDQALTSGYALAQYGVLLFFADRREELSRIAESLSDLTATHGIGAGICRLDCFEHGRQGV